MTTTTEHDLSKYLDAAVGAAKRAAAVQEHWRDRFRIREKAPADLVTDADLATQREIFTYLAGEFPDHVLLGEEQLPDFPTETPAADDPRPTWIIDPIDGTVNYAHDAPAYCVSIGLRVAGELCVGVIYDHRADEMFAAATGLGATLNGEPMRVSEITNLREGLLSTGLPADVSEQLRGVEWWKYFASRAQALRRTGSTALNLAYVACGRFDGYFAFANKAWDVAAGVVLVREAGGEVTSVDGSPHDPFRPDIAATNGRLQAPLLECLRDGP